MTKKEWIGVAVAVLVLAVAGAWYLFFYKKPASTGAVGTVENASKSVPNITTNPAEKVPEINPLDRVNPFKYTNPLR